MEYMFLLYAALDSVTNMTEEQTQSAMAAHAAIQEDARSRGVFRTAGRLDFPAKTITIQRANDVVTSTDGPYAETKEFMGGYYLLDCRDADEARYWAERLTRAGCIRTVEIRPMMPNG